MNKCKHLNAVIIGMRYTINNGAFDINLHVFCEDCNDSKSIEIKNLTLDRFMLYFNTFKQDLQKELPGIYRLKPFYLRKKEKSHEASIGRTN